MADPITIIGAKTKISGNLQGDEDLQVEGRLEGSLTLSRTLTIEEGGVVVADVNVRTLVVSGIMVGNVNATESVHILEGGRVVGDIAAPRVIIVDGASFRGQVDMGDLEGAPRTAARPIERPVARPAASARPAAKPAERPGAKPSAPASRPVTVAKAPE